MGPKARILAYIAAGTAVATVLFIIAIQAKDPVNDWQPYRHKLEQIQTLSATIVQIPSASVYSWQVKLMKPGSIMETDRVNGKPTTVRVQQGSSWNVYELTPHKPGIASSATDDGPGFANAMNIFEPFIVGDHPPTAPTAEKRTTFDGVDAQAFTFTRNLSIWSREYEAGNPTRESETQEITIYYDLRTRLPLGYRVFLLQSQHLLPPMAIRDLRVNAPMTAKDFKVSAKPKISAQK